VDSAVVRIDVAEQHLDGTTDDRPPTTDHRPLTTDQESSSVVRGPSSEEAFFHVVRAGFSEKRKQLKNNLRGLGLSDEAIAAALAAAGIDGRRRAETLTVEEWNGLTKALNDDGR
jgi:16S rRNA (adenine1518-N6/adenine1519-N6)-dimethyltransferase